MVEPTKIQFRPRLNRETTDYGNTGGWWDCNLVRWKTGTAHRTLVADLAHTGAIVGAAYKRNIMNLATGVYTT